MKVVVEKENNSSKLDNGKSAARTSLCEDLFSVSWDAAALNFCSRLGQGNQMEEFARGRETLQRDVRNIRNALVS